MTSVVALSKDLYSASILDLETVACFLAVHISDWNQETR
jgi:hypothetical protein